MRIENEVLLDYSDVLIRPKRSTLKSRSDVSLERSYTFRNYVSGPNETMNEVFDRNYSQYKGVPIMAANMDGVGTFEMADVLSSQSIFTCLVKTYSMDELVEFFSQNVERRTQHVAMSIGTSNADYDKFVQVYARVGDNLKYLCIDVANGYSQHFVEHVKNIRKIYPNIVIIAGNVVTADQTQELILNGADIVKVGIGPGSVCTTRIQTGVGYPQLSAIIECADAAHGLGGHIIADGGCSCSGDVAKAFAGGADFVMLGGMLAGHDEGGGEVISKWYNTGEYKHTGTPETFESFQPIIAEKKFVQFYGMSSDAANTKHFGGLKDYRASEGREVLVPYRGNVSNTIQTILGGIRSTCTYVGAPTLKQLSKCTTFIRVNNQYNRTYESTTTKM
jgi:GMP reductase